MKKLNYTTYKRLDKNRKYRYYSKISGKRISIAKYNKTRKQQKTVFNKKITNATERKSKLEKFKTYLKDRQQFLKDIKINDRDYELYQFSGSVAKGYNLEHVLDLLVSDEEDLNILLEIIEQDILYLSKSIKNSKRFDVFIRIDYELYQKNIDEDISIPKFTKGYNLEEMIYSYNETDFLEEELIQIFDDLLNGNYNTGSYSFRGIKGFSFNLRTDRKTSLRGIKFKKKGGKKK